jgi:hypothetical protein
MANAATSAAETDVIITRGFDIATILAALARQGEASSPPESGEAHCQLATVVVLSSIEIAF